MSKLNIVILYGSRSTEHEVSIITALQVMHNLDKSKYNLLPVYISKSGQWVLGNESFTNPLLYKNLDQVSQIGSRGLMATSSDSTRFMSKSELGPLIYGKIGPKIDLVFPVFHGTFGEDGTIQGLLEMANLPYVGCGVLASAVGMDKIIQKQIFTTFGLPQVKYVWIYSNQIQKSKVKSQNLNYPLFVKPANGGSSIGITKVKNQKELPEALEVAACFDRKIIIEESAEKYKEINISVLGNSGSELTTSVCEQPVPSKDILSYSDKYESGGKGMASAKRIIPAPIQSATAARIAKLAKTGFQAIDAAGLARVDFLVSPDEKTIYINEINTIPGSLAFYLWEKSGLPFPKLLDRLIELAQQRSADRQKITYTFSSNILANLGETLKGGKLKSQ